MSLRSNEYTLQPIYHGDRVIAYETIRNESLPKGFHDKGYSDGRSYTQKIPRCFKPSEVQVTGGPPELVGLTISEKGSGLERKEL